MINLKITRKSDDEKEPQIAVSDNADGYPWGTRINLEQDTLDKLGIKRLPNVGDELMIEAKVRVISVRESDNSKSVELQITDMDLENDGDEVGEGELSRGESKAISKLADKLRSM